MAFKVEDFYDAGVTVPPEELVDYDPQVIAPERVAWLKTSILTVAKLLTFPDVTTADRKAWETRLARMRDKERYYIKHHELPIDALDEPIELPEASSPEGKALAAAALALPDPPDFSVEWMAEVQRTLVRHRTLGVQVLDQLGSFRKRSLRSDWNRACNSLLEEWKVARASAPSETVEALCAQLSTS